MIKDLISNIIQNSANTKAEGLQKATANSLVTGEFNSLLKSIRQDGKPDTENIETEEKDLSKEEINSLENQYVFMDSTNEKKNVKEGISLEKGLNSVKSEDQKDQHLIKAESQDFMTGQSREPSNAAEKSTSDNQESFSTKQDLKGINKLTENVEIGSQNILNESSGNQEVNPGLEQGVGKTGNNAHLVDSDIFRNGSMLENELTPITPVVFKGENETQIEQKLSMVADENLDLIQPRIGSTSSEFEKRAQILSTEKAHNELVFNSETANEKSEFFSIKPTEKQFYTQGFRSTQIGSGSKNILSSEIVTSKQKLEPLAEHNTALDFARDTSEHAVERSQTEINGGSGSKTRTPIARLAQNSISDGFQKPEFQVKQVNTVSQNYPQIQINRNQSQIVYSDFNELKNPELIQVIQQHTPEVIKPKEAKEQRFALKMTEQAETRLKLLVDTVRPEVLKNREAPVGFITTHAPDEKIQFNNATLSLSSDQEAMLNEFMFESIQGKDQKATESNSLGYFRLSELPILNTQARRSLVSSFSRVLKQEMSSSTQRQYEQWQKHSFKLDESNNIAMTTRNIDGVLQIKLAASNPELNRLLLSMEQEIKDHIKEELNLELDLQFQNNNQETFSDSMNSNSDETKKQLNRSQLSRPEAENTQEVVKGLQPSIRNFGYNQMEWTA